MIKNRINEVTITGLGMACVSIGTMIMIPNTTGGFLNLGDGFILLFSSFLSPLSSFLVGGVASALVDFLCGYIIYAPYTLLIKGLEAIVVSLIMSKWKNKLVAYFIASLIMIIGYFLAAWNIHQNFIVALSTIWESAIQGIVGFIVAYLLYNRLSNLITK